MLMPMMMMMIGDCKINRRPVHDSDFYLKVFLFFLGSFDDVDKSKF